MHEEIITPDMMNWFMKRAIKPLNIKLSEDITNDDVLELSQYCPNLLSLNTCDFDADAQEVQQNSRLVDDDDADYYIRNFD